MYLTKNTYKNPIKKINNNNNEVHFLLFPTVYISTHFIWYVIYKDVFFSSHKKLN